MRSVASWRSTSKRAAISDAAVGSKPARSSSSVRQRVILSRSVSVLVSSTADISSTSGSLYRYFVRYTKEIAPFVGDSGEALVSVLSNLAGRAPARGARPARPASDGDDHGRPERVHLRAMRDE